MTDETQTGGSRSPNSPACPLPDTLEAARKLWAKEKRSPVSNETAALHFGFKSLSGPARVMIGSMRQYGLIERTSDGHFKLTDRAVRALQGTPEQQQKAIAEAAVSPPLFQELSRNYMDASEATIRSYLITKKGFVDSGARKVAAAFRATMQVANVAASGYDSEKDAGAGENKRPPNAVAIGDFVQWESGGVLQFPEPLRVRAVSDDWTYVFVEGSATGIPMTEVSKAEPPSLPVNSFGNFFGGGFGSPTPQPNKTAVAQHQQQQTIPPMNWVLSVPRGVRAQLIITGDVRAEDLKRLKAQIDFLVDSFADDAAATS